MPKMRGNNFWCSLQSRQEIGYPRKGVGSRDYVHKRLYSVTGLRKESIYDYDTGSKSLSSAPFHGGIFNLSFSPEGSVLIAATERKALLLFDPLTHKMFKHVGEAHLDSVNYVKFLDSRLFATCSDDCTVALWDLRMLKNRLQLLRGHSYWVKNIEYDSRQGLLLSSSYDGCVNVWDINKHGGGGSSFQRSPEPEGDENQNMAETHNRVLYLSCIMRMRLTCDSSKMVICTSEGYIMVIHDLDLLTLSADLKGFQSDLYRLMQKGHSCGFDFGSWYNNLFTAKRNRVELISDFPSENDAHSITSLDVHPHNWAILSRNISRDENSEWTCVHDIQPHSEPSQLVPISLPKENIVHTYGRSRSGPPVTVVSGSSNRADSGGGSSTGGGGETAGDGVSIAVPGSDGSPLIPGNGDWISTGTVAPPPSALEMHVSPVVIISARTLNRRAHATILNPNTSYRQIDPESGSLPEIYTNSKRLTHYREELNVGPGFIKELCFSPDGRVICSPYEYGYRILSFNENCSEMSDTVRETDDKQLHELRCILPHSNYVVTTKFSPTHLLIASGCLSGKIVFSQPVL